MVTLRHAGMKLSCQYKFQITVKISEMTSFALKSTYVNFSKHHQKLLNPSGKKNKQERSYSVLLTILLKGTKTVT